MSGRRLSGKRGSAKLYRKIICNSRGCRPASGKDELIAAVDILGAAHAQIVPKHSDREWRIGDGNEMICRTMAAPDKEGAAIANPLYDLNGCDIRYENYGKHYGIKTSDIWDKLSKGIFQVVVVSNKDALNKLRLTFGKLVVMIYVHSLVGKEEYIKRETQKEKEKSKNAPAYKINYEYLRKHGEDFDMAWKLYEDNFMLFDHVLIYTEKQEDLFYQIFRLFRAYEHGLIK